MISDTYITFSQWQGIAPEGIVSSLIATAMWVLAGYLLHIIISRIRDFKASWRQRKLKSFLGYKNGNNIYILVGSNIHRSHSGKDYRGITVPIANLVYSLADEINTLYNGKIKVNITFDHNRVDYYFHQHTITIGGPGTNELVKYVVSRDSLWSHNSQGGTVNIMKERFFCDSSGTSYRTTHLSGEVQDFGLFAKLKNEQAPTKPIFLLYGLETFGTCASILGLVHLDSILTKFNRRQRKEFSKSDHTEMLFKVSSIGDTLSDTVMLVDTRWIDNKQEIQSINIPNNQIAISTHHK